MEAFLINFLSWERAVRLANEVALRTGLRQQVYKDDWSGWTWKEVGA